MLQDEQTTAVSERFRASDADITFISSDQVLFKVHKKNLEVNTGGFSLENTSIDKDGIPLPEKSDVMELLFQFIYPKRHPTLRDVEFEFLERVTDAVEKYQIYPALEVCKIRMEANTKEHLYNVMEYAVRHRYTDILDQVGSQAISVSQVEAFKIMSPPLYIVWTRYYAQWLEVLKQAHTGQTPTTTPHATGKGACKDTRWPTCFAETSYRVGGDPKSFLDLDAVFKVDAPEMAPCPVCQQRLRNWRMYVEERLEAIPKFGSFI